MASLGNLKHHINSVAKQRGTVISVDPSQMIIEVATSAIDGDGKRIAVYEFPNNFVWPRVGEIWSIYQEGTDWILGNKIPNDDEVEAMQNSVPGSSGLADFIPGDLKLSANPNLQYGWLQANGGFVRIIDYPELFAVLGHAQNNDVDPGDGTFKLPLMDNDVWPNWVGWIVKT